MAMAATAATAIKATIARRGEVSDFGTSGSRISTTFRALDERYPDVVK